MDGDSLYVQELRAAYACKENKGFVRRWAKCWLDEIRYQDVMLSRLRDYPIPVMGERSNIPDTAVFGNAKLVTLLQ